VTCFSWKFVETRRHEKSGFVEVEDLSFLKLLLLIAYGVWECEGQESV
jgi:hypothetical protein